MRSKPFFRIQIFLSLIGPASVIHNYISKLHVPKPIYLPIHVGVSKQSMDSGLVQFVYSDRISPDSNKTVLIINFLLVHVTSFHNSKTNILITIYSVNCFPDNLTAPHALNKTHHKCLFDFVRYHNSTNNSCTWHLICLRQSYL